MPHTDLMPTSQNSCSSSCSYFSAQQQKKLQEVGKEGVITEVNLRLMSGDVRIFTHPGRKLDCSCDRAGKSHCISIRVNIPR